MLIPRFFSRRFKSISKFLSSQGALLLPGNNSYFFGSSTKQANNKVKEEVTNFFVPPEREPYNDEKDDPDDINTYVEFDKDLYSKIIGQNFDKNVRRQSCYYAIERNGQIFHVFDASRMPYGRMCSKIAYFIQGKHKPIFKKSQVLCGDNCIVVNASNIKMTGTKKFKKTLKYHTGYVGHLKEVPYRRYMEEKPEQLITYCVSKMLPKNKMRPLYLEKLKIYREELDMVGFPNFLPLNQNVFHPLIHENPLKLLTKEDTSIVYESEIGPTMEEFKDFKREEDPDLAKPFEKYVKTKEMEAPRLNSKRFKRYKAIAKRYKDHKFKPKKNNDPRNKDFYLITSEKQVKKYHLDDLNEFKEDEGDEDEIDDTMK